MTDEIFDISEMQWGAVKSTQAMLADINDEFHSEWINYFEGIIDEHGAWYDLRGSHTTALEGLCAEMQGISIAEFRDAVPVQYYADYNSYLLKLSNGIAVRYEFSQAINPSAAAVETYNKLCDLQKIKDIKNWVENDK